MTPSIIVRAAPQEYICRTGCWEELEQHLRRRGLRRVLIVHGSRSWSAAAPWLPVLRETEVFYHAYSGECTYEERDRIAGLLTQHGLQAVIGIGGGKITDLTKAAGALLKLPAILLPTLAATCAAWSSLSVMYDEAGRFRSMDVFPYSNALVLVDPRVIAQSPPDLLVAGIGDTLAKWYEADVIIRQLASLPVELELAWYAARKCRDTLLECSEAALSALQAGEMNDALLRIIETNIMVAGLVGGFGEDYGRTAGAHSIHDALTAIPEAHQQLHGHKVAYGVLVQLALEGQWAEITSLLPFYRKLGLPAGLKDMGLGFLGGDDLLRLAERAIVKEASIHRMPGEISAVKVAAAIEQLEKHLADYIHYSITQEAGIS
ncbi:iron-containing alcohol dehydrogenase family protein [Paenibacillus donghaensis]|uniref:Oxidoreductase n=1 Tax=Paenibacillus donghaensis TaxID=414771 RepID=A0A2Z2K9R9_9BACL|nr:iron-containing alcohol dehydrogenase family protein [Paenibacillus donghaensis]ASA19590.1 oxidoreductase [Paenibacillus donghaensis]